MFKSLTSKILLGGEAVSLTDDFPTFYTHYERLVRSIIYPLVGSNDLDDVVQKTFIRCWEKKGTFEGRSKVSTWVTSIAINQARDHWKMTKLYPTEDLDAIADQPTNEPETEIQDSVSKAVKMLDLDHREVISLKFFQDKSLEEIAEILNEPIGTVKSRIHYGKIKLKEILDQMGVSYE